MVVNYFAFISTHLTRRARSCLSNLLVTKLMNDDYIPRNLFQFKITLTLNPSYIRWKIQRLRRYRNRL